MYTRIAAVLLSVLILVAGLSLRLGHDSPPPIMPRPDPALLPGQPFTLSGYCDYEHSDHQDYYCFTVTNGDMVDFVVQAKTNLIESSTWVVHDLTVGDFIGQWGKPTGIKSYAPVSRIYFGTTSVWLMASPFSPDSRVYFITYADECGEVLAEWHGFSAVNE